MDIKTITIDNTTIEVETLSPEIKNALQLREEWLAKEADLLKEVMLYRSAAARIEQELYDAIRQAISSDVDTTTPENS